MRNSDRWVTPAVVIVALLICGGLGALTITAMVWLTARGLDPNPMLKLVAQVGAGAVGLLSLVLQLLNRVTVTKTERNTGVLASAVHSVADVIDTRTRPAAPPPVPEPETVAAPRHRYPETGAAPVRGS